jgi:1-acyl-sn-glycerol-3-phosphate acyltransferase
MDSLVLFSSLPQSIKWNIYFGAAADRWFIKGRKEWNMQPWYRSMVTSAFPIQRGGGSRALDYPKWLIDQGCNVMIFPEGTRSSSRSLAKFRHGVSILALEKKVPVVPIYLTGLRAMRAKGSRTIVPGPAGAHVLDPIHFPDDTSVPDATRVIYSAMNEVHQRVREFGDEAADY